MDADFVHPYPLHIVGKLQYQFGSADAFDRYVLLGGTAVLRLFAFVIVGHRVLDHPDFFCRNIFAENFFGICDTDCFVLPVLQTPSALRCAGGNDNTK